MNLKSMLGSVVLFTLGVSASAAAQAATVEVRIPNETAPPGGMVQMKVLTTEATPISGGSPLFAYDASTFADVAGIGIFDPTGEAAGAAVISGTSVNISYIKTTIGPGGYPILTVALPIKNDVPAGSQTFFALDPSSTWILGDTTVTGSGAPARVTVGGSISITDVVPGEGFLAAGDTVSIRGVGFTAGTQLAVRDVRIAAVRVVSSTEIQFTLAEATELGGKRIEVTNRDNSRASYYSYTRGIPAAVSSRALLSMTRPLFSGGARSVASFGPLPEMSANQYAALALQNPALASADVTVALYAADDTLIFSTPLSLGGANRLALEVSEVLDGVAPPPGAYITVTASLPIQGFWMLCDESAWTVTPAFARETPRP
jgi:hypothetical protein